ncbi:hypothetical protein K469DRAFT_563146, partial [Zopfia rhizophila CBS 207.26]
RGTDPLCWILFAVPEGSNHCTYYHVQGGPTLGTAYFPLIQANKRVNSFGIASGKLVRSIYSTDISKLKSSA